MEIVENVLIVNTSVVRRLLDCSVRHTRVRSSRARDGALVILLCAVALEVVKTLPSAVTQLAEDEDCFATCFRRLFSRRNPYIRRAVT